MKQTQLSSGNSRDAEPLEAKDGLDDRQEEERRNSANIQEVSEAGEERVSQDATEDITLLQERIGRLEEQISTMEEALLRSRADYDNYRKRVAREQSDLFKHAEDGFLSGLFPVMDNFELGFRSIGDGELPETVRGFRLIFDQLNRLFAERHVHSFGAAGEAFDPHRHDALSTVNDEVIEDGHIVQVVRRGYEREGRLLRAASVIVSRGKKAE